MANLRRSACPSSFGLCGGVSQKGDDPSGPTPGTQEREQWESFIIRSKSLRAEDLLFGGFSSSSAWAAEHPSTRGIPRHLRWSEGEEELGIPTTGSVTLAETVQPPVKVAKVGNTAGPHYPIASRQGKGPFPTLTRDARPQGFPLEHRKGPLRPPPQPAHFGPANDPLLPSNSQSTLC